MKDCCRRTSSKAPPLPTHTFGFCQTVGRSGRRSPYARAGAPGWPRPLPREQRPRRAERLPNSKNRLCLLSETSSPNLARKRGGSCDGLRQRRRVKGQNFRSLYSVRVFEASLLRSKTGRSRRRGKGTEENPEAKHCSRIQSERAFSQPRPRSSPVDGPQQCKGNPSY